MTAELWSAGDEVETAALGGAMSDGSGRGVVTLFLEGELGPEELSGVASQLERLYRQGRPEVVLDLSDVSHLDYRAVRPLVKRIDSLRKLGAEVKLSGVSPYLMAILRASGAHGVFQVYADAAMAERSFEDGFTLE